MTSELLVYVVPNHSAFAGRVHKARRQKRLSCERIVTQNSPGRVGKHRNSLLRVRMSDMSERRCDGSPVHRRAQSTFS